MANATGNRIGQVNGAGASDALFLKVFGGEVLAAFDEAQVTLDKHTIRTIPSGKSAAFPASWKVNASYHTPGAEIVGQVSNVNERIIAIDDLLLADVFLASIDEAKNHYEVRSEYSHQVGQVLANQWDKNVLQVSVLAARATTPLITGAFGGETLTSGTTLYRTSAADLAAGIYALVQKFDEKDIPENDTKYAYVRPAQYYLLAQSTALINRDWMGAGSYSDGKILRIGGAQIVKTNHLPITNIATGPATYQGDFSKTACVITTKRAVGTVKLLDLAQEMGWDMRRQGTLIIAKYAVGHGILRADCAGELKTST